MYHPCSIHDKKSSRCFSYESYDGMGGLWGGATFNSHV